MQNVPVVSVATAWQSREMGQTYILIFNEALWMGDSMRDTIINPNQLQHFGTIVHDNPMPDQSLSIFTNDYEFCMDLSMKGTIVGVDTHTPSDRELSTCPHIILTLDNPWNPYKVKFPQSKLTLHDIVSDERLVSAVSTKAGNSFQEDDRGDTDRYAAC